MKVIDLVIEVLTQTKTEMHVDDIAKAIIAKHPATQETPDILAGKISSTLSSNIKKKDSLFTKPKNKTGGYKRGIYKLKLRINRGVAAKKFKVPEQPKVNASFTGKAGEHSVMSELLFFGFNASAMAVDDGIDIVASKDNLYFHIQVKTANLSVHGKYRFTITKKAFGSKDAATTFYILVMRSFITNRNVSDHLIFPSSEVRKLVDRSVISNGESLTFSIEKDRSGQFILNGLENLNWSLNRYDNIK
jgi:hypothetical protein